MQVLFEVAPTVIEYVFAGHKLQDVVFTDADQEPAAHGVQIPLLLNSPCKHGITTTSFMRPVSNKFC